MARAIIPLDPVPAEKSADRECKLMLVAATPEIFEVNGFRIIGVPVDATIREINRQTDRLRTMMSSGQGEQAHVGAFALFPPPADEVIREANQRLRDPEQRILDEFFWFWPRQSGQGASDSALQALADGDADTAFELWAALESNPEEGYVARHNLAILRQLMALEWENHYTKAGQLTEENKTAVGKLWRSAFKRWNLLATDDDFWGRVTARIRQLDDPRLTSGLIRVC